MKWTYHLTQKTKIAVSLAFVIVLVLATNFLSKQHFAELQDSFTAVYRDRLMAEIYLFNFNQLLHEKNQLLTDSSSFDRSRYHAINDSIHSLVGEYEMTVLTKEEAIFFNELKEGLSQLTEKEKSFIYPKRTLRSEKEIAGLEEQYKYLWLKLDQLSDVQRTEGKRLIDESKRIIASSKMTLQLELVILIVVGVIVQVLIFSAKSTFPKTDQHSNLN